MPAPEAQVHHHSMQLAAQYACHARLHPQSHRWTFRKLRTQRQLVGMQRTALSDFFARSLLQASMHQTADADATTSASLAKDFCVLYQCRFFI